MDKSYSGMYNVCRLCLYDSPEIMEEIWEGCDLLNKLSASLSHSIALAPNLPKRACRKCCDQVEEIYKFDQKLKQTEILLKEKLNSWSNNTNKIKLENNEVDCIDNDFYDTSNENCNQLNIEELKKDINTSIKDINIPIKDTNNLSKEKKHPKKVINSPTKETNDLTKDMNSQRKNMNKPTITTIEEPYFDVKESHNNSDNIKLENPYSTIKDYNDSKETPLQDKNLNVDLNTDELKFKCLTCFEAFSSQLQLLRHYQNVELERYNKNNAETIETEPVKYKMLRSDDGDTFFVCEKCGKKYDKKKSINRHILSHSEKRPYYCKLCGKTYATASIIVNHGRVHAGEKYMCSYNCGYSSVHKHVVKEHEKRHRKEFKYKCDTCGKGFQVKTWYEQHQNIHKGIKPFVCDICGMTYHLQKYLSYHKSNVHPHSSTKKMYLCKICALPCDCKNTLKIHMKEKHGIATKLANLCDVCGKVLKGVRHLVRHKRTVHSEIKPYVCGTCSKCFATKFSLSVHEKLHSGEGHSCSTCLKRFSRRDNLWRHMERCKDGSKYPCQKCEQIFPSKNQLSSHKKDCR